VKERLAPGLHAYIEYSNEVWNNLFAQYSYAVAQGRQLLLAAPNDQEWDIARKYYSLRSVEIFKICEGAFGGTSRLRRVLASQSVSSFASDRILSYNGAHRHADALAIAPYFGGEHGGATMAPQVLAWNLDQLFADLTSRSIPEALKYIRGYTLPSGVKIPGQQEIAAKYSVQLIAYEGGQHLVGVGSYLSNPKLRDLFHAANRDPRMKDVYAAYLKGWRLSGAGSFVHYNHVQSWSQFGSWGAAEVYPGLSAQRYPKYEAIQEAAGAF
jgi:hypothetical protein